MSQHEVRRRLDVEETQERHDGRGSATAALEREAAGAPDLGKDLHDVIARNLSADSGTFVDLTRQEHGE